MKQKASRIDQRDLHTLKALKASRAATLGVFLGARIETVGGWSCIFFVDS